MEVRIENIYTSVACNKAPESADWGKNGLICFGASHALALLDPQFDGSAKIIRTYIKHEKKINTAKWVPTDDGATYCLTGSDDGKAILWVLDDLESPISYTLQGHESTVNVVAGICSEGNFTLATASTDSSIKLWHRLENTEFRCFQTISLRSGFCFALALTISPQSRQILLSYAGDSSNISLLTETSVEGAREFVSIHSFIGHEDWVRCLDFTTDEKGDLLLASSSQDHYVRLWRIAEQTHEQNENESLNILTQGIRIEENIFQCKSIENGQTLRFAASLESVLHGHEGWVYGVHWYNNGKDLQLLTSSIDKTMIVWDRAETGVWMEKVRVGEVGGNLPGFYGGKFGNDGKVIFGHGFQGSFHIWRQSEDDENAWIPQVIVGGHFNEVRDICWEPTGQFLLSVSADATTRIHAPWIRSNKHVTWHEIARPQVHGYDMQCITTLSMQKFASGAEEKIIRVFQAPVNFMQNFKRICAFNSEEAADKALEAIPKGASVPSLGLSNKAVYKIEEEISKRHVKDEYPENYFVETELTSPPEEEILMQNTLWPEMQKLYGHGFEIFAICSTQDGKILASACRAQSAEHAQIILWDTSTWKQIKRLPAHKLTVTQMKFSPNGKYLLSVSRDRSWKLFEDKEENESCNFEPVSASNKDSCIHTRVIWSCDWSHDSEIFVTTSRDGKAVAWYKNENDTSDNLQSWKSKDTLNLPKESITAAAFPSKFLEEATQKYLIALGCETGRIILYTFAARWEFLYSIANNFSHHLTVRKLHFKPNCDDFQLASCGSDNIVRIVKLCI